MKKASFVLLLISLTSCMSPYYSRPEIGMPTTWRLKSNEGSTLANVQFWKQFQDESLDNLISCALKNNDDLKIAIYRVKQYQAALGISEAALLPTVDLEAAYSRNKMSLDLPGTPLLQPLAAATTFIDSFNNTITGTTILPAQKFKRTNNDYLGLFFLRWELDFWGRLRSASAAAYADLMSQVEARRAVVTTVVGEVANAYIILRKLDSQLEISRQTLETRKVSLKLAENRFEVGETSKIEVTQAASEVEIAAISVIQYERDVQLQENLLSILVGEKPREIMRGKQIDKLSYPIDIPAGIPSDLLERRPDIAFAEQQLIAADARIIEAKALLFPRFSLTGNYGSESDHFKQFLKSSANIWEYGLSMSQTIIDFGSKIYGVKQAKAIQQQALYNYRKAILNGLKDVDDSLVSVSKNSSLVKEHEKQVEVLTEYLNLANLRYLEGEIDYLNVLDAERSRFDAELNLVSARAANLIAIVNLYRSLGGGWIINADEQACSF